METGSQNAVEITQDDLRAQAERADPALSSTTWDITPEVSSTDPSRHTRGMRQVSDKINIIGLIEAIDPTDDLPSDAQLHATRAIRNALRLGRHVAYNYLERANVPESTRGLPDALRAVAIEKNRSAAAIMNFVIAQYLLWDMCELSADNTFLGTVAAEVNEVNLERPMQALRCATYYLGKHIERNVQSDDAQLAATIYRFAESLRDATVSRVSAMVHFEPFTLVTYLLEGTTFSINGFETVDFGATASV